MAPPVELSTVRFGYRAALARAVQSLHRHEHEFEELCERLEGVRRDLRAAGYLHERPPPPEEPGRPAARRWNRVVERAQLKVARELARRRGGPSSGVPVGHPGHATLRPRGRY
jgi:hypothetical protein